MKRVVALYFGNAKDFLRDRSGVFFILMMPLVLAIFFGVLFGGGNGFTLHLGVVNRDTGPAGENFISRLAAGDASNMIQLHRGSEEEVMDSLNRGELSVVMVLPEDLSESLSAGRPATVQVYHDPSRATSTGAGLGMVQTLLGDANLSISGAPRLLQMEPVSVHTRPMRNVDFYFPGMLGLAFLWLGLFGTAAPLVEQRQAQVLRRLAVTPVKTREMVAGQVSWRVTIGLFQALLFVAVGYLAFQVGVLGSPLLFVSGVLLGTLVFVSMGYVLAGLASTVEGVSGVSQLVNFPMMFLSGAFIPVEVMPEFLRPVANVMPLTYLNDLLRQLMVDAPAVFPMWMNFAVLGGWLVAMLALATRLWRWE